MRNCGGVQWLDCVERPPARWVSASAAMDVRRGADAAVPVGGTSPERSETDDMESHAMQPLSSSLLHPANDQVRTYSDTYLYLYLVTGRLGAAQGASGSRVLSHQSQTPGRVGEHRNWGQCVTGRLGAAQGAGASRVIGH